MFRLKLMGPIHPVTVEALQFSSAEPVAYEGIYKGVQIGEFLSIGW
jgi:hypothetical protein